MNKNINKPLLLSLLVAFGACADGTIDTDLELRNLILGLNTENPPNGSVSLVDATPLTRKVVEDSSEGSTDVLWLDCGTQHWKGDNVVPTFATINPSDHKIWPGAILSLRGIESGAYESIDLPRAPMSLTINNVVFDGGAVPTDDPNASPYSVEVNAPSYDAVDAAVFKQMESADGVYIAGNTALTVSGFQTSEQATYELSSGVKWPTGSVEPVVRVKSGGESLVFAMNFVQALYSVSYSGPSHPETAFDPKVGAADLAPFVSDGLPPVFVQRVTYGRQLLIRLSAQGQQDNVIASLLAAKKAFNSPFGVNKNADWYKALEASEIEVIAVSNDPDAGKKIMAKPTKEERFAAAMDFIAAGNKFSPDQPGVPISFNLAYLANNAPVLSTTPVDYTFEGCAPAFDRVEVLPQTIHIGENCSGGWGPDHVTIIGETFLVRPGEQPTVEAPAPDGSLGFLRRNLWSQPDKDWTWDAAGPMNQVVAVNGTFDVVVRLQCPDVHNNDNGVVVEQRTTHRYVRSGTSQTGSWSPATQSVSGYADPSGRNNDFSWNASYKANGYLATTPEKP